jgi:hypothetical protein
MDERSLISQMIAPYFPQDPLAISLIVVLQSDAMWTLDKPKSSASARASHHASENCWIGDAIEDSGGPTLSWVGA